MGTAKHREWRSMGMFEEALGDWQGGCLTQDQAAALLGVSARTFRRWMVRYGEDGLEGLRNRREGGQRSYTWVRNKRQSHGAVAKGKGRDKHRRQRTPAPWPGVMRHQNGTLSVWHGPRASGSLRARWPAAT